MKIDGFWWQFLECKFTETRTVAFDVIRNKLQTPAKKIYPPHR